MSDSQQNKTSDGLMIFGTRPVMEAIDAGKDIERIFIQRDLSNPIIKQLKLLLTENGIGFSVVPVEKLNRLTRKNHQGVVGFLGVVSYQKVEDVVPGLFENPRHPIVLILDRITDVRNFGAICRTAECMNVDAVIIPEKGGALVNGDALKASAGAISRLVICREHNLKHSIDFLKDSGFVIVGCTEKASSLVYEQSFDGPICLIMGSEEDGISPEYLKRCDVLVKIPMAGKTSSLNVSVASGMVLYEISRQSMINAKHHVSKS